MLYFICGMAGVVVGALITLMVSLAILRRGADRDLIERRMRAYLEYRDCLGEVGHFLDLSQMNGEIDPVVFRQAWKNVTAFCREFRLTSWLLRTPEREALGKVVGEFEREARVSSPEGDGTNRASGPPPSGSLLQRICDRQNAVDRILRRAVQREIKEHRRFRFSPGVQHHTEDTSNTDTIKE